MVGIRQEAPGRIEQIEVQDFKSYRGRQVIGPFKNFTAVIGPNGSGKSNLMDAISFVLGMRTAHLRGSLKELLYKGGKDDKSVAPTRASVKLVYITGGQLLHALRLWHRRHVTVGISRAKRIASIAWHL